MKERPIIFSGPMVRALLDGSKTQTRRVVKPQFAADAIPAEMGATNEQGHQISGHSGMWWCDAEGNHEKAVRCPYGLPGDRLWVREAHEYTYTTGRTHCLYKADSVELPVDPPFGEAPACYKNRPSIHMHRWASRITLEVTGVRIERLQDISRGDAMEEGCPFPNMAQGDDPRKWYAELWGDINGPGSWDANPWVWAIEFRRLP